MKKKTTKKTTTKKTTTKTNTEISQTVMALRIPTQIVNSIDSYVDKIKYRSRNHLIVSVLYDWIAKQKMDDEYERVKTRKLRQIYAQTAVGTDGTAKKTRGRSKSQKP